MPESTPPARTPAPARSDIDTWGNDNQTDWTDFNGGKWLLIRKLYKPRGGPWKLKFTKKGNEPANQASQYVREAPLWNLKQETIS